MDEKYKVVPNSLNYGDIKPESIQTDIKLCKYVPTATVTQIRPGASVKFLLSGAGFLDPYSTFLQFSVDVGDLEPGEIRFLDRSAHSFIQSIIIKSQGVELERLDSYDVMCAMINDMIYSPEQNALHAWEGFPTAQLASNIAISTISDSAYMPTQLYDLDAHDAAILQGNPGYLANLDYLNQSPHRRVLTQLMHQGASPMIQKYIGEVAFFEPDVVENRQRINDDGTSLVAQEGAYDFPHQLCKYQATTLQNSRGVPAVNTQVYASSSDNDNIASLHPQEFSYHTNGYRQTGIIRGSAPDELLFTGCTRMTFIIPLYSSVLGILMPEKKLLPLGLLPLDIEIKFNEFALYSSLGSNDQGSRRYTISDFNLYSNVVYFESDIHKQIESQTAERGLFIYCNTFQQGPIENIAGRRLPKQHSIPATLKSVNSVHFLFMYSGYADAQMSACTRRKLHFVSHNLTKLQIRNGNTLYPQYAVEGHAGTSWHNEYVPFMVELLKGYNKMHDPKTDAAIQAYNYCGDVLASQYDDLFNMESFQTNHLSRTALDRLINKQGNVGRCQYAIALDGEELGTEKMMITGRKVEFPFAIQYEGLKSLEFDSVIIPFIRCDFIVYVRPDLQIVTLGK